MIDATRDLTVTALRRNLAYWLSKWDSPPSEEEPWDSTLLIPVTHTFGAWRRWGDVDASQEFTYKNIFFRDKRLVSDYHRHGVYSSASNRRIMSKARKVNLDRFVFAYFGVHDQHYARCDEIEVAAFGVYIRPDLEVFPRCNATRRDLNSNEAEWPPDREFLLPRDARFYVNGQAERDTRHFGDFWHYWGNESYFRNSEYATEHWNWKVEFHFHRAIPVGSLEAVLWPYELRGRALGARRRQLIGGSDEKARFEKMYPRCKVIPYHWSNSKPMLSLVSASFAVTRYRLVTGRYPESADDASYFLNHET